MATIAAERAGTPIAGSRTRDWTWWIIIGMLAFIALAWTLHDRLWKVVAKLLTTFF